MERGRAQTGLRLAGVWLDTKGVRASPPVRNRLGKRLLRDFAHIHCCRSLACSCWAGDAARGWPWRRRRVARRRHCAGKRPPGGQNAPNLGILSRAKSGCDHFTLLPAVLNLLAGGGVVGVGPPLSVWRPSAGSVFPRRAAYTSSRRRVDRIAVYRARIWTRKLEACAAYRLMGCSN